LQLEEDKKKEREEEDVRFCWQFNCKLVFGQQVKGCGLLDEGRKLM
jgi:hypothetical protein